MSKLTASLTALDAVATGIKTWLSGSVDLTHLTTFEDEELGKVVVGVINEQLARGEAVVDEAWRPWPEVEIDPRQETVLVTISTDSGSVFAMETLVRADGTPVCSQSSCIVAWKPMPSPWNGR